MARVVLNICGVKSKGGLTVLNNFLKNNNSDNKIQNLEINPSENDEDLVSDKILITPLAKKIAQKKNIDISKIKSGPIFRRFSKGLSLTDTRLSDQSVVLLMKEYLNLAGIENKNFAGHSLRSGFATVAAESGADERSIMAMTGHKTTQMVRRYIKEANLFKNNALNKVKL